MLKEVPLTPEQRKFAADHHNLIYSFLNEHHLPENDYYDIVVFGYLKAVRDYFSRDDLKEYSFGTIAWKAMYRCLSNHYKAQRSQKRNAEVVSIHISLYGDGLPLEQTIPAPDTLMERLEAELFWHELAGRISRQQLDAIHMKSCGYGVRDIAHKQNTTIKRVRELLDEARDALAGLCYE